MRSIPIEKKTSQNTNKAMMATIFLSCIKYNMFRYTTSCT